MTNATATDGSRNDPILAFPESLAFHFAVVTVVAAAAAVVTIIVIVVIVVVVAIILCRCDAVVVRGPNAHNISIPRLPIISFTRREFASINRSVSSVGCHRVRRVPADRIQRSQLLSSMRYIFKERETETEMETLTHRYRHRSPATPYAPLAYPLSFDACIDRARGSSSTLIISFDV